MNQNAVVILIALAFGAIGFTLGRVTCSNCCVSHHHCCSHQDQCCAPNGHGGEHEMVKEIRVMKSEGDGEMDVQVIVDDVLEGGFEGDTTIAIEGGEIRIERDGEDVRVEVEMDDE